MTWYNERDRSWGLDPDDLFIVIVLAFGLITGSANLLSLWMPDRIAWPLATLAIVAGLVSAVRAYRKKDPSFRLGPPPLEVREQRARKGKGR